MKYLKIAAVVIVGGIIGAVLASMIPQTKKMILENFSTPSR